MPAAQMAACVELQDKDSFWKLHDFFYADQGSLSASSLQGQVEDFLAKQTRLNIRDFEGCVDRKATDGQVEDDVRIRPSQQEIFIAKSHPPPSTQYSRVVQGTTKFKDREYKQGDIVWMWDANKGKPTNIK